jgi:hypothetical protein
MPDGRAPVSDQARNCLEITLTCTTFQVLLLCPPFPALTTNYSSWHHLPLILHHGLDCMRAIVTLTE